MTRWLVAGILLLSAGTPASATQAADTAAARRAFDFLLGSWRVTSSAPWTAS